MEENTLFDTKGAAKYLTVGIQTMRNHRRNGTGPKYHRPGGIGQPRYYKSDIDVWVKEDALKSESKKADSE